MNVKKLVRVFARVIAKGGKPQSVVRNIVAADLPQAVVKVMTELSGLGGEGADAEIRAAQVVSDVDGE